MQHLLRVRQYAEDRYKHTQNVLVPFTLQSGKTHPEVNKTGEKRNEDFLST
jgi:hypothetical protein